MAYFKKKPNRWKVLCFVKSTPIFRKQLKKDFQKWRPVGGAATGRYF